MLDRFNETRLQRLWLYFYLIPIFGFFPALWTLSQKEGTKEQQRVSRLTILLALGWLLTYSLLGWGAMETSDLLRFRLLVLEGLVTSGYFLTCLGLMVRLWQKKSLQLPWVSKVAEQFKD